MKKKPNILWIMTDQQRLDSMGCTGGKVISPNIDRLADEGMLFTRMFAQSPVCVPSRVNFITGRYPHSHKSRQNHILTNPHEPHMFRVLRQAGYSLGMVGKNHMFTPQDLDKLDFERCDTNENEPDCERTTAYNQHLQKIDKRMLKQGSWAGACWHDFPEELTRTGRTGSVAVDYIEKYDDDKPFMLWVSFEDPHASHTAPERLKKLYPEDKIELPKGIIWEGDYPELIGKPFRQQIKRHAQMMSGAAATDLKRYIAVYRAMTTFVDEQVGKIISTLENRNLLGNTIVIFTSDHGDFLCDHGMVKKDLLMYDCQLNIPFIVRYPGLVKPGSKTAAMCEQIDIYPTLLDCLAIEAPNGLQGDSFKEILTGNRNDFRSEIHAEVCPPEYRNPYADYDEFISEWNKANNNELTNHPLYRKLSFNIPGDFIKCLRTDKYKYVWYADGQEELYDLENDPGEIKNIADNQEYKTVKTDLKLRLLEWNVLSEDSLDWTLSLEIDAKYPW